MNDLFEVLCIINSLDIGSVNKYLTTDNKTISIENNNSALATISPQSIMLANKFSVEDKLLSQQLPKQIPINYKILSSFLEATKSNIIRLNHIGVSYFVTNIQREIAEYKHCLTKTQYDLFEENSGMKSARWFFIGNTKPWDQPLFEIVLTQAEEIQPNGWIPHIQIDIDIDLPFSEIHTLTNIYLGETFLKWNLTIPDYGTVLTMGRLGVCNGINIYLGIGTNLRNVKYHREQLLRRV